MFDSRQLGLFSACSSSAVVSHAKMSPGQARAPDLLESGPVSGSNSAESSASSSLKVSSLKTSRAGSADGCVRCGTICTLSATERAPSRFLPPTSGLPIFESASSSSPWATPAARSPWPTPSVCGNYNRAGASPTSGDGLETAVKVSAWPTPSASSYGSNRGGAAGRVGPERPSLETLARWASPRAKDADAGADTPSPNREGSESLRTQAGAKLNPAWVESLMGFPPGWTDIGGPLPVAPNNKATNRRGRSMASKSAGEPG